MDVPKRILREYKNLAKKTDIIQKITLPDANNIKIWHAHINGPKNSIYENANYILEINFGSDYPLHPPKIYFLNKIFHPNISKTGGICLDVLSSKWSALTSMESVIIYIHVLMLNPNPDDPFNRNAGEMYTYNKSMYEKTVKDWILKYASNVK